MEVLNSALDEAEKEISRGLEELMKLKEDFKASKSTEKVLRLHLHVNLQRYQKQTGPNSKTDRIIEARRPSTSSTTSDAYNSPTAQSPQLDRMNRRRSSPKGAISKSNVRKDMSCQTQN
ncbi:RBR-type E3 ubiquitin transferase [Caerostris extrusa]|uniref:RBR-type E3 ubiquitin transferase n=1 Tax=Caerostris extrusa TaxID=172846 RepID=A0AAV4XGR3_CAEEX|nr:RBR-type E3 ubiquitin transferase [Caerostris extrusa]